MTSRPCSRSLIDQNFGLCITPEDLIFPFYYHSGGNYCRPWRWGNQTGIMDSGSTINEENNTFKISLDVQHFEPEEIKVKVNNNEIIIEAKHEEKLDKHGFISRQFTRRYKLPCECPSDSVECTLSSDGILITTAKKITRSGTPKEIVVPILLSGTQKLNQSDTKSTTKIIESDTKTLLSCNGEASSRASRKDNLTIIQEDNSTTMKTESDAKTLQSLTTETSPVAVTSKDNQIMLKEDHCRLLKPELLGVAASGSRDEELKQITEQISDKLKTSESGCSVKVSEATSTKVAKTQLVEKRKEALSDNKFTGLGSISTNDQCQMTSDLKDINRISELSSALEEASATSFSTTENIEQSVGNMNINISASSTTSQEVMEVLETSSLKSNASGLSSQESMMESKLKEGMKLSESLGKASARSSIEDMMDKCSAELAEITNKYSDSGFIGTSGTAKMQSSMSYSSSEIQESSYSSSTVKSSGESASMLVSGVMAELREAAENVGK